MNFFGHMDLSISQKLAIVLGIAPFILILSGVATIYFPYSSLVFAIVTILIPIFLLFYLRWSLQSVKLLEIAAQEAQISELAKNELLANVRHELSTPMTGIIGLVNLLKRTDLDDQQSEMIELIFDSAVSQMSLLNDLNVMPENSTNTASLAFAPFDPAHAVQSVVGMFSESARQKKIELNLKIHAEPGRLVLGDLKAFRQISSNLIGNAVKFTDNGKVDVRVELSSQPESQIWFQLEISDTGPGIPDHQIAKVFERYYRVQGHEPNMKEGSGLGLSICRSLADTMGGEIALKSNAGSGSQFIFTAMFEEYELDKAA